MFQGGLGGSATPMVILLDLPLSMAVAAQNHAVATREASPYKARPTCL